jgi:hypothetical protein
MATMLPNIALFAETGQWGTLSPLCLVTASGNMDTRELVQSSLVATMGGAAWLRCCRMSHYMRRRGKGGTLNPLCLVDDSDHRATRELVQSSWMATMGVLHGYYVAEYRIICRDGARGTLNPLCLVAASDNKATRELVQSLLDGDGGGTAWLRCCRMSHYLRRRDKGDTQPTLPGGC